MQIASLATKFFLRSFFWDFLTFPFWWYSRGLQYFWSVAWACIQWGGNFFGAGVWLRNIFVPMYGQYDRAGRIISFFIRFFQVFIRGVLFLLWTICILALFFIWIFLPLIALGGIIFSYGDAKRIF